MVQSPITIVISGSLYTSTSYKRSTTKCDYLLCLGATKTIGSAQKYISFCLNDCSCSVYCHHVVIVKLHNTSTGVTRYIHRISDSRYNTYNYYLVHIYCTYDFLFIVTSRHALLAQYVPNVSVQQ